MATVSIKKAKRYARALFELCQTNEMESFEMVLKSFSVLIEQNPVLVEAANNPGFSKNDRQNAIVAILSKAGIVDSRVQNLSRILVENSTFNLLPTITKLFSEMVLSLKSQMAVEVTSAFDLEKDEIEKLKSSIQSQFGKLATVTTKKNEELIGGMVIKIGDKVLDRSWAGALQAAAIEFTN
jgi:F-type H+-transporting ATPase subunit delta